jgi:hypothetical protein
MIKFPKIIYFLILVLLSYFTFSQTAIEADAPKKHEETKITEVVQTDSLPAGELANRAVNWVKVESVKYGKTSGVVAGTKTECTVTFQVKPKDLNPVCDYTGKIVMKVLIECKTGKYKYTIFHIKHIGKIESNSAGSIDNLVPDCGTMKMTPIVWKKLKGEAITKASFVVTDIKEAMKILSTATGKEDW